MVCFDKTFEAAEALLHMESPGGLHSERNTGKQMASDWQFMSADTQCLINIALLSTC